MASKSTAAATAAAARRRKIAERGTDRLALITGRIPSLPAESSSVDGDPKPSAVSLDPSNSDHQLPPPHLGVTADKPASQPSNSPPTQIEQPLLLQKTTDSVSGEDETSGTTLLERDVTGADAAGGHDERNLEHPVPDEISGRLDLDQNPTAMGADSSTEQLLRGNTRRRRVSMTPSQISSGITASERTRVLCSAAIAILVVLSSLGFPLLGNDVMKGILSFRPLYLLLITNVTIVLAAILSNNNQRGSAMVDDGAAGFELPSSGGSYDWAAQASKALEISFLAKKAIEALVMVVSIYAVIVVCAFCLLR